MSFGVGRDKTLTVKKIKETIEICYTNHDFPIMGKKNIHSLVFDVDREIPILESTATVGKLGKPRFMHCPLTFGLRFLN